MMNRMPKTELFARTENRAELIACAVSLGMPCIGFPEKDSDRFPDGELSSLRRQYDGKIRILRGRTVDPFTAPDTGADYLVGRVWRLCDGDGIFGIPEEPEAFSDLIRNRYAKDAFAFLKAYFDAAGALASSDCLFVSDVGLSAERLGLLGIREDHPRYRRLALDAADVLLDAGKVFELYIDPREKENLFPSTLLLRRIAERRGSVILSSRPGNGKELLASFPAARHLALASGIGRIPDDVEIAGML